MQYAHDGVTIRCKYKTIQLWVCVRHKTNPKDNTVGMSPRSLSAPNADFDGDALYLLSIKEMVTVLDCMKIHPISTLLGGEGGKLYPAVKMTAEEAIAGHGWLIDGMTKSIAEYRKMSESA